MRYSNKFCAVFALLLLLGVGGCSFLDLRADLKKQDQLVTITGEITAEPATTAPVKILLVREDAQGNPEVILHRTQKHLDKYYFIVEPGTYRVLAFEDMNRDGKFTPLERVKCSASIDLNTAGHRQEVNIEIGPQADPNLLAEIADIKARGKISRKKTLLKIGTITSLDASNFSRANASMGLWQPYKFVQTVPFGCYFLKEYEPKKKIVLFVHGVSGLPPQFRPLIENLDPDKFQPLILFYPSGFPLSLISQHLNNVVNELQATLDFDSMSMVAHSMGGLASRGFLNIQSSYPTQVVDCFISISTPWNGHAAASSGLKYAPVIIPVWRDVAPGSDFLKNLFTTPLSEDIPHYLLFGFKGTSKTAGGNSDGVVSIASQLKPIIQKRASLVRGFDEDHVSILSNKEVSTLVNELLEKHL